MEVCEMEEVCRPEVSLMLDVTASLVGIFDKVIFVSLLGLVVSQ